MANYIITYSNSDEGRRSGLRHKETWRVAGSNLHIVTRYVRYVHHMVNAATVGSLKSCHTLEPAHSVSAHLRGLISILGKGSNEH